MDNREVARLLEEIATLLELKGENPFKSRAYQNAARAVDALEEEVAVLVASGRLAGASGIGPSIADKLTELVQSGRLATLDDLRREVPAALREMVRIPGLGPKRARALHDAGCTVVLNPDARSAAELANTVYALATARRGWIEAREVMNARSWEGGSRLATAQRGRTGGRST